MKALVTQLIDIVLDGPPGPDAPRFIEVEDAATGRSIAVGTWVQRDDGHWALRLEVVAPR
jgi:hypothetical protein